MVVGTRRADHFLQTDHRHRGHATVDFYRHAGVRTSLLVRDEHIIDDLPRKRSGLDSGRLVPRLLLAVVSQGQRQEADRLGISGVAVAMTLLH